MNSGKTHSIRNKWYFIFAFNFIYLVTSEIDNFNMFIGSFTFPFLFPFTNWSDSKSGIRRVQDETEISHHTRKQGSYIDY